MRHIVLAGGDTAGHVNPLLSVADAIRRLDASAQVSVIGTDVGLERTLVPDAGYESTKSPFQGASMRRPCDSR